MAPAHRLRLVYLLYYGNVGAFMPFFPAYLRGLGFSGREIGLVQMLPSLLAPAVAPAWAAFAERRVGHGRALAYASGWAALAALFLPFVHTPLLVGAVVLLMALGDRSVVPLLDSMTLEHVRARPGAAYTRIRLFGSLGFILFSSGVGALLTARGSRAADPLVPILVAALVGCCAVATRFVPSTPAHPDRPGLHDMLGLLRSRPLVLLLGACAAHWIACAPFHLLYGVFVRDHGLSAEVAGAGWSAGVIAEIAALLLFPRLQARLGLRALFAVAFLGSAVRWVLLASAEGATAIVLLQLLHGLTFGVFWGCATGALGALVPSRLRATGQALFTAVVFGGGNAAAYALAGAGYDRYGAVGPLFLWSAALELALAAAVVPSLLSPRSAGGEAG